MKIRKKQKTVTYNEEVFGNYNGTMVALDVNNTGCTFCLGDIQL